MAKKITGLEDLMLGRVELSAEDLTTTRVKRTAKPKKTKDNIDYLSSSVESFAFNISSKCHVPNIFPTVTQPYRIAIIGEAPGRDEELQGLPFVGASGQLLTNLLSLAGILRQACFIGNVCQRRPTDNDINNADLIDVEEGITQLTKDLNEHSSNICVLLGNTPLRLAKPFCNISDWRGSYFISTEPGPFFGRKCIATYHPAACLCNYEWMPLLMLDLKKALAEAFNKSLNYPTRNFETNLTSYEIIQRLKEISLNPRPISIDIEGGIDSMSCISVATSGGYSFIIPFTTSNGDNYWLTLDEELSIWSELASVLADSRISKILQNALYDRFVLQYSYSLIITNNSEDTMLKSWELYCELEKGLGFLCSLYTNEPFYKSDRKSDDMETFWRYCCKDSAVTYEISQKIQPMLNPGSDKHYRFNVELLNAMLYMELKGIRYDIQLSKTRVAQVNQAIYKLQAELDVIAMCGVHAINKLERDGMLIRVREVMCFVRDQSKPKKDFEGVYQSIESLIKTKETLSNEDLAYISIECGWSMNLKSKLFKEYLYDTLQLPKQYKTDPEGKKSLTTDGKALLKIQKQSPHPAVELAIQIAELRTRSQMLTITADEDGRIRAGYNIVGASTGRITCYTSPTGSGYNLQTIPDDYESYPDNHPLRHGMRDLFMADEGYHLFQCDLKGSDGWTIGANMAALGDPSMLDDLRAGIKPAARICYLLRHGNGSLHRKPRDEVKELLREVKKTDWDYFACKVGIWGICYLMGVDLLADEIAEESQGKLWLSRKEVEDFRNAVFSGYNVKLWHNAMAAKLAKSPYLTVPSGHKRRFFSRKQDILGQALAHEPQANTTYATNLAAFKLWRDEENRTPINPTGVGQLGSTDTSIDSTESNGRIHSSSLGCTLRIQPLHQVHDALLGQFRIEDTSWAVDKIKTYFNNEIIIAGIPIVIPFEGNYGKNWANLNEGTI